MKGNQSTVLTRWVLVLLLAGSLAGCGGGDGGGSAVDASGQFAFDLYWGADTRSLEINGRSLRVTASRQDGAGTPVVAVFNRPSDVDIPQNVRLPGDFQIGTHEIRFEVFDQANAQGTSLGVGRMTRRMVPNSKNTVRVNIGAVRGFEPFRITLPRVVAARVPFSAVFDTRPVLTNGGPPIETEVNLVSTPSLGLDLNGGVDVQRLDADRFVVNQAGYYNAITRLDGTPLREQPLVVQNLDLTGPSPVVDSVWPTSGGSITRGRVAFTNAPTQVGTPRYSSTVLGAGPREGASLAVLASGDVAVAGVRNGIATVAVLAPDLSVTRWRVDLALSNPGTIYQLAALRNGLLLVETHSSYVALDVLTGREDWRAPRADTIFRPTASPLYRDFVVNSGDFLSIGSGQVAFQSRRLTRLMFPDGSGVDADGLYHVESPGAVFTAGRESRLWDPDNQALIRQSSAYFYLTQVSRLNFMRPIVGLVPNQPAEWIAYGTDRLELVRSSDGGRIRQMESPSSQVWITYQNRVLVTGTVGVRLLAFGLDDGREIWRTADPIEALGAGVNRVYAVLTDGRVVMIGP